MQALLLIEEVAEILRVPRARVYNLAREGLIPVVMIGRQVRVSKEALERWINMGGKGLGEIEEDD